MNVTYKQNNQRARLRMAKFYLKCLTPTWYGEGMYLYNGLILTVAVEATGRTLCLGFRDSQALGLHGIGVPQALIRPWGEAQPSN